MVYSAFTMVGGDFSPPYGLIFVKLNTVDAVRTLTEDIRHVPAELPTEQSHILHTVKSDACAGTA